MLGFLAELPVIREGYARLPCGITPGSLIARLRRSRRGRSVKGYDLTLANQVATETFESTFTPVTLHADISCHFQRYM